MPPTSAMANQYVVGLGGDAPKMLAVLWSLTALALVFFLLRLYTRLRVIRAYGLDDYFYNASFVCVLNPHCRNLIICLN